MTAARLYPLKRAVSRPNADKALRRLDADLSTLIDRAPLGPAIARQAAALAVAAAIVAIRVLYRDTP
jgi:hypothetical protein